MALPDAMFDLGLAVEGSNSSSNAAFGKIASTGGPWICDRCGFRNRAQNAICGGFGDLGCRASRAEINGTQVQAQSCISAPVPAADGSWICRICSFNNRAANQLCGGFGHLGCKAPRPEMEAAAEAAPTPQLEIRWTCSSCSTSNEASNDACSSCKAARRYTGTLKSVGGGYGFISCSSTAARFGRDVYVSKQVLDAAFGKGVATSGVLVSFLLCLNNDGQPNARHVTPQEDREGDAAEFEGVVKYLSEDKGYAFVECPDILMRFGGDAFAGLDVLQGCGLGQRVVFSIRLGQVGGRPQVCRLRADGPPPAILPAACRGAAAAALHNSFQGQRVLLLGEGDLSFACAAARLHPESQLDATVFLSESQWRERFPEHLDRITDLEARGHHVRFSVDAAQEDCAGCSAVFFNFPCVSAYEAQAAGVAPGESPSGGLASAFLERARASADGGTLLVLGLWSRCDGGRDPRLYGQDAHALVASAVAASQQFRFQSLDDALEGGYERDGVQADYGFYEPYEEAGYSFRTSCAAAFESSHSEWHLKACFVLRVNSSGYEGPGRNEQVVRSEQNCLGAWRDFL